MAAPGFNAIPMRYPRVLAPRTGFIALALLSLLSVGWTAPLPSSVQATFYPEKLAEMDDAINQAIADKQCPGGVLWLEHRGVAYHKAYGNRALVPRC